MMIAAIRGRASCHRSGTLVMMIQPIRVTTIRSACESRLDSPKKKNRTLCRIRFVDYLVVGESAAIWPVPR